MSDKHLTEAAWKAFAKGRDYNDAALVKALVSFAKADPKGTALRCSAADEIEKQAQLLLKATKSDKEAQRHLSELLAQIVVERKALAHAQAQAESDDSEGEEPAAALLDPQRLLQQLVQCKRDAARRANFGFVEALDKQPATLALNPKVSGRKLFASLQAATGSKLGAYGTVWLDDGALMVRPDKPLGGLAKKLRGPIKAVGFRVTAVVLVGDGGEVLETDEQDATDDTGAQAGESAASDAVAGAALAVAFNARLKGLLPQIIAVGAPAKALAAQAAQLAKDKQDWLAATALLDQIEAVLNDARSQGPGATSGDISAAVGAWASARTSAVSQLKGLAAKLATTGHKEAKAALLEINAVMKNLTAEPRTLDQVKELERYLRDDDVVVDICTGIVDIRTPLLKPLAALRAQLTSGADTQQGNRRA